MSDFSMSASFTRGEIAQSLVENPEQAGWVVAELVQRLTVDELLEGVIETDQSLADVASFYADLAAAIRTSDAYVE